MRSITDGPSRCRQAVENPALQRQSRKYRHYQLVLRVEADRVATGGTADEGEMRMSKPRLLDLFCKAGGSSVGYFRAGFDVWGVDIEPQPRFPWQDRFILGDALQYVAEHGHEYDAIAASPPCQGYSRSRNNGCHKNAPLLIPQTQDALRATGLPYVIENVLGSPLFCPVELCGASFGLRTGRFDLSRHRLFECNFAILVPPCVHRRGQTIGVYGNGTNSYHRTKFGRCIRDSEKKEAMGIDWMNRKELANAIPPAYTEFIGRQLLNILANRSSNTESEPCIQSA